MSKSIYKISFISQGIIYEIYARRLSQSSLIGFIEIEELIFGEKSSLVVDPSEEKLKNEFESVKRSYIPMHTVLRIDEVEREGIAKIRELSEKGNNISLFPSPMYSPLKDK